MSAAALRSSLTAIVTLAAVSVAVANEARDQDLRLKDAQGQELTTARCGMCHSVDYIQMHAAVLDRAGWERSIQKMIERFGAPIEPAEAREIAEYLGAQYSN